MNKTFKYIRNICLVALMIFVSFGLISCRRGNDGGDNVPPTPQPIPPAITVSLDKDNIFLGEKTNININVKSEESTAYTVEISDPSIVKYDNNVLEGLAPGTVEIKVSSQKYTDIYKTINLTVMPDLKEESYVVKNIATGVGEDASTSTIIKYEAYNKNTSVEYTVKDDTEFSNAKKIIGSCYYFEELSDSIDGKFPERYIYRTIINGLEKGTEYIYRVNNGDNTYSETYSFKTAKGSGDTTFIYLTDTHYWVKADGTSHGSEISELTIKAISDLYPDATFVLDSGDTIDTGGNSAIWNVMYEHRQSFKSLAYASVPGNHEYYVSGTSMWDNRFFKASVPTLLNGPECRTVGSSYYFVYNDVLFLLIDNVKKDIYTEQYAWMEEVLRNTKAKYSVATYHIPSHEDNTDNDPKFNALFQKYGVDLVLAGHYHTEDYDFVYDNVDINSGDAGVTFFRGASSGVKGGTPVGYAITITEEGHISIKGYGTDGTLKSTFEFDSIKYKEPTNEEISYKLTKNEDGTSAYLEWGKGAYGKYEKIEVFETLRNEFYQEVFILSNGYTGIHVPNVREGYDSLYKLVLTKKDGSTETVYQKLSTNTGSLSVSASSTSATLSIGKSTGVLFDILMDHYDIYVNGELHQANVPYSQTSYVLSNLNKNTKYSIELKAIDYDGKVAYTLSSEVTTSK